MAWLQPRPSCWLGVPRERRRHAIDLVLRHRPGERERERTLEGRVGAGEGPTVAIGRQVVDRVRADLRLDALGPQPRECIVAPVEAYDVRLPAVPVALVDRRRADEVGEPLRVPARDALPGREEALE